MGKKLVRSVIICVIITLFLIAPQLTFRFFNSTYVTELLVQAMIYGICAFSLNLLLGYMKHPALGHAVYLGLAAYTVAICITKFHFSAFLSSMIAIFVASFAAAVFGLFALRARGVYFLMITLSIAMLVWGLAYRWVSVSGGDNGISGILRPQLGSWSLQAINDYYYFVFLIFLLSFFVMYRIIRSPFGQTIIGIKESESRMRTLGYNCWLHRYICFVIAGFFSGVSGVLFIFYNGYISPPSLELLPNMEILLMVALGGPATVVGPYIGSVIIIFVKNFVSIYTDRWLLILGSIYIITVLYTPKGVLFYAAKGLKEAFLVGKKFLPVKSPLEKRSREPYGK